MICERLDMDMDMDMGMDMVCFDVHSAHTCSKRFRLSLPWTPLRSHGSTIIFLF